MSGYPHTPLPPPRASPGESLLAPVGYVYTECLRRGPASLSLSREYPVILRHICRRGDPPKTRAEDHRRGGCRRSFADFTIAASSRPMILHIEASSFSNVRARCFFMVGARKCCSRRRRRRCPSHRVAHRAETRETARNGNAETYRPMLLRSRHVLRLTIFQNFKVTTARDNAQVLAKSCH